MGSAVVAACGAARDAKPATSATASRQRCFLPGQVNDFHAEDDQTVYVTIGTRRMFRLEIVGTCPDIDWSQRIGIRARGGGSWICGGLDAELIVPSPSPSGVQRCPVTNVTALSDAEVDAYRERRKARR
ncbi:hypothetical protein ETR14_01715 [Sphingosinicella sp. BN140058]|nr:hypothetical protein ETR14_01715 [Sphingosinicella sp. BN140058]